VAEVFRLDEISGSRAGRTMLAVVAVLIAVTATGMVGLWPDREGGVELPGSLNAEAETAEIVRIEPAACPVQGGDPSTCADLVLKLESGVDEGAEVRIPTGGSLDPAFGAGDRLRVVKNEVPELPSGGPAGPGPAAQPSYSIVDFERSKPMLLLVVIFAGLVVITGRFRGALSLVGLGISLAVVFGFIVPAILADSAPLAVAIVGAMAVMLTTILLTHGLQAKSLAAILGTTASLLLTAALAVLFVSLANLTGFSSEEATFLRSGDPDLSLSGLVLAGTIIAALGVLDDVTVSQASLVMALKRANPAQRFGELFAAGISVGRDHVAATVNTLVLAYVGASLPILLVFSTQGASFANAVNREAVAEQVVGTLVGSIGLIAAVPLTTALAALLAERLPRDALPEADHVH
jgi:uncharacterized membrane protein